MISLRFEIQLMEIVMSDTDVWGRPKMSVYWKFVWKPFYQFVDVFFWYVWRPFVPILLAPLEILEAILVFLIDGVKLLINPTTPLIEVHFCYRLNDFLMFQCPCCRSSCFDTLWEKRIKRHTICDHTSSSCLRQVFSSSFACLRLQYNL